MSAKPELVMVVHARYPLGEPRVEREARAASDAGYRVRVVCLRHKPEAAREWIDGIDVQRLGVFHRRGVSPLRILAEYVNFTCRAAFELAVRRPPARGAIVQFHSPPDFILAAGIVPRLRGCKLVLDVHDISRHIFRERAALRWRARPVELLLALVERVSARLASLVLTVHEPYRLALADNGIPTEKIHVVMNSADPRVHDGVRSAVARPSSAGFVVAYHGTLTPWYGVELLIEAIATLRDDLPGIRGLIIGEGDALPGLRRLARGLGTEDRITFSGRYLPHTEALAAVCDADCGVIPNRATWLNLTVLPTKLLEYVELGVPAVVSRLPTVASHFDENEVRFFDADDALSLAAAIRWVAENPEPAAEMADRARSRAVAYSWDRNRSRYLESLATLRAPN